MGNNLDSNKNDSNNNANANVSTSQLDQSNSIHSMDTTKEEKIEILKQKKVREAANDEELDKLLKDIDNDANRLDVVAKRAEGSLDKFKEEKPEISGIINKYIEETKEKQDRIRCYVAAVGDVDHEDFDRRE